MNEFRNDVIQLESKADALFQQLRYFTNKYESELHKYENFVRTAHFLETDLTELISSLDEMLFANCAFRDYKLKKIAGPITQAENIRRELRKQL